MIVMIFDGDSTDSDVDECNDECSVFKYRYCGDYLAMMIVNLATIWIIIA